MRMWMVNPQILCRQHLLGEHHELHMITGCINKGISLKGYLLRGLIEIDSVLNRHDVLVSEMKFRGYRHASPLIVPSLLMGAMGYVDIKDSLKELFKRCSICRRRFEILSEIDIITSNSKLDSEIRETLHELEEELEVTN